MSNTTNISHKGIIEDVEQGVVTVRFTTESACAACHAKGMCGVNDMKEDRIKIQTNELFSISETVDITISKEMGINAVLWAYVYPFLILITTMIIGSLIFEKEIIYGIISILILIPYYYTLYLHRDRIEKRFIFNVKKIY